MGLSLLRDKMSQKNQSQSQSQSTTIEGRKNSNKTCK